MVLTRGQVSSKIELPLWFDALRSSSRRNSKQNAKSRNASLVSPSCGPRSDHVRQMPTPRTCPACHRELTLDEVELWWCRVCRVLWGFATHLTARRGRTAENAETFGATDDEQRAL